MTKSENVKQVVLYLENIDLSKKKDKSQTLIGVSSQEQCKDDLKKVTVLINCLYDIIKIYGYDDNKVSKSKLKKSNLSDVEIIKLQKKKTSEDKIKLRNEYLQFVYSSGHGTWKDLFKYKINAYFSFVMKQEVPPPPKGLEKFPRLLNPCMLFHGRAKRFLKKLNLDRKKEISLAQSIAQSKKGAPPVSEEMVAAAEYKTYLHLGTAREDSPTFFLKKNDFEYEVNRDTMKYQLRRTVRELFGNKIPTWDDLAKPFVPSTNSNYNFSRNKLGGVGAFKFNSLDMKKTLNIDGEWKAFPTLIEFKMGEVTLEKEISTLYGEAGVKDQEILDNLENIKKTIGLHYDTSLLDEHWKNEIYEAMLDAALNEKPKTIVIGLPEPLKVRCITAGPPITYAFLKPMQKWLWKNLKEYPVFKLIGTPITAEIVKTQLGRLGENEKFLSGDYVASTDNLHSWVSESLLSAFDEIWTEKSSENPSDKFNQRKDDIVLLMKRALTGHTLLDPRMTSNLRKEQSNVYNTTADEEFPENVFLEQKEGQLMGSIISFIFLCLANAAMCRWAMEISEFKNLSLSGKNRQSYEKCRLLVNGDDCVFPGNGNQIFDIWKKICEFGGLSSSVGKTFFSEEFLTMNSVQYQYNPIVLDWEDLSGFQDDYEYEEIKYVNLGLVYGQKKDGIRNKHFYNLGAVHRDLKKTCPPELFSRATKIFLREAKKEKYIEFLDPKSKKTITKVDPFGSILHAKVPYYLPEWLGGLGFVPPENSVPVSDWDLKVAGVIRSCRSIVQIRHLGDLPHWQFHKLVSKKLKDFLFLENQNFVNVTLNGETRTLESQYQELYSKVVVDILIHEDLKNLVENTSDREEKVLQENHIHNMWVWEFLRKNPDMNQLVYSEPIPKYTDLLQEKKSFFLSCWNVTP